MHINWDFVHWERPAEGRYETPYCSLGLCLAPNCPWWRGGEKPNIMWCLEMTLYLIVKIEKWRETKIRYMERPAWNGLGIPCHSENWHFTRHPNADKLWRRNIVCYLNHLVPDYQGTERQREAGGKKLRTNITATWDCRLPESEKLKKPKLDMIIWEALCLTLNAEKLTDC